MHAFVYPRPAHHKMYLEAKTEGGVSREDCNIEVIVRVSVGERWLNLHQRAHQQNLDATLIEDNRGREPRERKDLSLPHTPKQKHERTIHPAHTSSEQVSYQEQSQLFARIIPEALSRRPTCTHSTVSLRAFESTRDRHNRCACSVRFPLCPTSLNDLYFPPSFYPA